MRSSSVTLLAAVAGPNVVLAWCKNNFQYCYESLDNNDNHAVKEDAPGAVNTYISQGTSNGAVVSNVGPGSAVSLDPSQYLYMCNGEYLIVKQACSKCKRQQGNDVCDNVQPKIRGSAGTFHWPFNLGKPKQANVQFQPEKAPQQPQQDAQA